MEDLKEEESTPIISAEQPDPPPSRGGITRRSFLKGVGVGIAAISLGHYPGLKEASAGSQSKVVTAVPAGEETAEENEDVSQTEVDNQPESELTPSPTVTPLPTATPQAAPTIVENRPTPAPSIPPDRVFKTEVGDRTWQQLQDELKAARYGGPWDVASVVSTYNELVEKPWQTRPKDIVPVDQLAKWNIVIHQTSEVKLEIREGAFQNEPFFKLAKEYAERYETVPYNPYFKLEIVLADDDGLNAVSVNKIPAHLREIYQEDVNRLLRTDPKGKWAAWISRRIYWNNRSDFDIRDKQTGRMLKGQEAKHNHWVIFMAIGGWRKPKLSDTMPPPERISSEPPEWVLSRAYHQSRGRTYTASYYHPGFILLHELQHLSTEGYYNTDELHADMIAYQKLRQAYEDSKTGNLSGYSFVFTIPGGFILTETRQQQKIA